MNKQTFELLILGSSAAIPTSERNPTSQLLNICERYFLIDCAEGTQMQLRKFKCKFQSIDHIFISHLHGDHFFGLPGLLSSMHLLGRKQEISIYCPEQLKAVLDIVARVSEQTYGYTINWIFTNDKGLNLLFEDAKVQVYSFPLRHRIFCTGFLFIEKPLPRKINKEKLEEYGLSTADIPALRNGSDAVNIHGKNIKNELVTIDPAAPRSYAYCSDTIFNTATCDFIKGVDLLYHESTFLEDNIARAKKTFHSTAKQAGEIAKMAGAKKLLLGHYSTRYGNLEDFVNEARSVFMNCELSADGKKIII